MEDHQRSIDVRVALLEQHTANHEACIMALRKEVNEMKERQSDIRSDIRINGWKIGAIIGVIVLVGIKLIDVAVAWGVTSIK